MHNRDVRALPERDRRCSCTLPATASQVRVARRWLRGVLGADNPCLEDAQVVISELATNAIQHGSRDETSRIRVTACPVRDHSAFVSVTDEGWGDGRAWTVSQAGHDTVRGRGLELIDSLAVWWDSRRTDLGHCVYALVSAPMPVHRKEQNPMPTATTPMPKAFMLIGHGGPNILNDHGRPPTVIDAEGVQLLSGAVYTWCRTDCCPDRPRSWPSIEAAADFHGSLVLFPDEAPRDLNEP